MKRRLKLPSSVLFIGLFIATILIALFTMNKTDRSLGSTGKNKGSVSLSGTDINHAEKLDPEELHQMLLTEFQKAESWTKVRAGEDLIQLDARAKKQVSEVFLADKKMSEVGSPYRVGVLRVLYRCGQNSQNCLQELRGIAFDGEAPGKIHAVETLSKLAYHPTQKESEQLLKFMNGENSLLADYSAWLLTYSSYRSLALAFLTKRLTTKEPGTAEYAFYYMDSLPMPACESLSKIMHDRNNMPVVRISALRSLLKHQAASPEELEILIAEKNILTDEKSKQFILQILSEQRNNKYNSFLEKSLHDDSADIRIAAAYALLNQK